MFDRTQALDRHTKRFRAFDALATRLRDTQTDLTNNAAAEDFIDRVGVRDNLGVRFYIAAKEWKDAYVEAARAQSAAIRAYNALTAVPFAVVTTAIRTEVRVNNAQGVLAFPAGTPGNLPAV